MSDQIDDGGPAFPIYDHHGNGQMFIAGVGATLRDYFAAKAMQAVPMQQGHLHDVEAVYDRIADHAYKMADAMLKARQK